MATPSFALGFTELVEGNPTTESFDFVGGSVTAKRTFIGPWEDRIDFINDHLDKVYPDMPQARIADIQGTGDGIATINSITGQATWDRVILSVTYSTDAQEKPRQPKEEQDREDFVNNRFITEAIEGGIDILQTEGASYQVSLGVDAGDNLNQLDKINFLNPLETITITQNYLGIPNWLEYSLAKGKINNNAWISPSGIPFAANTLLYEGTVGTTKIDVDTRASEDNPFPVWELTHKFSHKVIKWNTVLHKGRFQEVVRVDENGNSLDISLYDTADMYSIFFGAGGRTFDPEILTIINNDLNDLFDLLEGNAENIKTNTARNLINSINAAVRGFGFNV